MKTIPLHGSWKLRNRNGRIKTSARVPGDTHSALLQTGQIPDPYWAENELKVQGLGWEDWIYERSFEVPASVLKETSVFLNCENVDTVAAIYLNGQKVAQTRNAFVRFRFEVKKYLRVGRNELRIELSSPEKAARAENKKMPYPIPHNQFPIQSQHRNLLRKVQCHAGWDWGPCLMVSGIYGDIYLGATSLGRIEYVTTEQKHRKGVVEVVVSCEVLSPQGGATALEIKLGRQTSIQQIHLQPGLNILRRTIRVEKPRLWWPNGLGAQALYDLTVTVAGSTVKKRLGLRTIEVENKEDKDGLSMTFVVNGVPIFCKGANWIPTDALPQRQTRSVLDDLLTSAVQANMNMIRVWGGGQYEPDDFYDLCDEKGLLIWHDFMFSCALYPATPDFLAVVEPEIRHQVKRLKDHPSLALWCGNNEDVGAMNWYEESRKNRDRYIVDYDRLNEGVIGRVARELDPARMFWPSSPCGGPGDYSDCWHADGRGDMHFWNVWHESKPFENYLDIRPRFCSEFGYQSFPSLDTIRTYASPDQFNVTSPVMEHHQRNPGGNTRITENFARYFRVPEGFDNFVYLSQVQQALAIKIGVEHWRRLRPVCMGTLFWQLNDQWPVCSWASVEYGGKWKLLHYVAKRFYAPLVVSVYPTPAGGVEIWANNDRLKAMTARVQVRVMNFSGKTLKTIRFSTRLKAASSTRLKQWKVSDLTSAREAAFLVVDLRAGGEVAQNEHFFCEYKKCELLQPELRLQVKASGTGFQVTVKSRRPSFWTSLNASGLSGEFDDNCFTVLPGETKVVTFTPKQKIGLSQFRRALEVRHLRGTYT